VLAHFVSAEQAMRTLIEDVYAGGAGAVEDFDIDRFNAGEVADWVERTPDELLREFEASRQSCVALVRRMESANLANVGRHPFLGPVALEDIIKMLYRHDQIHLRDLRRLLKPEAGEIVG